MSKIRSILELSFRGASIRGIAEALSASRNTVRKVLRAAKSFPDLATQLDKLNDYELEEKLFPESSGGTFEQPDFSNIHKELLKVGVSLKMLWKEYYEKCQESNLRAYSYQHFCSLYNSFVDFHHLTLHLTHKPGHKVMVDWAGKTMSYYDKDLQKHVKIYLFVGVLPFSGYCFVKPCRSQNLENWLNAHIEMFQFFGGTPEVLVPDNLKTGVVQNKRGEDPVINRAYREMAKYYDIFVNPARVRKPQDKAAVENAVRFCANKAIGLLRNQEFFSLEDLSTSIKEVMEQINNEPYQKKSGSRFRIYDLEERKFLKCLPSTPYEFCTWKTMKVPRDYHIVFESNHYSVPCEYVSKKVDIRVSYKKVVISYANKIITEHERVHGSKDRYVTVTQHMPRNHQFYSNWTKEQFLTWVSTNGGPFTQKFIEETFEKSRNEEQAIRSCTKIVLLSEKYTPLRLENACALAYSTLEKFSYNYLNDILKTGQDKASECENTTGETHTCAHTRGADYYA